MDFRGRWIQKKAARLYNDARGEEQTAGSNEEESGWGREPMKCPECGYVSFDDLRACKKCGASLETSTQDERVQPRPQKELFSFDNEKEAGGEEAAKNEEAGVGKAPPLVEEVSPGDLPPFFPEDSGGGESAEKERGREEESGASAPALPPGKSEGAEDGETSLPDLELDIDTAADEYAAVPVPEPSAKESAPAVSSGAPEPIFDDETVLPEDLWVEEGAGFLPRLLAFAVDSLIILTVLFLFFMAAAAVLSSDGYGLSRIRTPEGISALFVPFYLLSLFLSLSYFTFFLGWTGTTPGKALFKLDVRRTDGGRMSYTRAFLRWVGYLVSVTFAGLGFLWVFFDERKRGWHDYLSGTWVKNLRHES